MANSKAQLLDPKQFGGHNVIPYGDDSFLFLDICSGTIFKHSLLTDLTTQFEVQPPEPTQQNVLLNMNGLPTILQFPSDYSGKLQGICHFENGSWKKYEIKGATIVCNSDAIAVSQDRVCILDINEFPFSEPWSFKILCNSGDAYERMLDKDINVDFLLQEANWNSLPQPRLLVAGAFIVNLPLDKPLSDRSGLLVLYCGQLTKTIDEAPVHRAAVYDFVTKQWTKHEISSPQPNFAVLASPSVHFYDNSCWFVSVGHTSEVWRLRLDNWSWTKVAQVHTNLIACAGLSKGSCITPDGKKILLCLKHKHETVITVKEVPLH